MIHSRDRILPELGRRYVRLNDGDRVVLATVLRDETSIYLASAEGHVIHFPVEEINVLAGVGKGVMGIKLEEGDACLGGILVSGRETLVVEASDGKLMEFRRGRMEPVARGGKGSGKGVFGNALSPSLQPQGELLM